MKALVALLALAAVPANAHAGSSCGGGGGGGSSGGGGGGSSGGSSGGGWDSSSSSSSDSGSSSSTTVRCDDSDEPVGFRTCTQFAQWSGSTRLPRVILGFGTVVRRTPSLARGQTGHITHADEGFSYRMVDTGDGSGTPEDTAVMASMRIGFGLSKHLYAAGDFEAGGITSDAPKAEMTSVGLHGSPTITGETGLAMNMLGVVGARTGRGRSSLAIEAAGGVHVASYQYQSQYVACQQSTSISGAAPLLEVRASAEHWLNPWVNVGATFGGSVIDRGAWMTGIYVGISTRVFGGER